jgi:hypothetical protein
VWGNLFFSSGKDVVTLVSGPCFNGEMTRNQNKNIAQITPKNLSTMATNIVTSVHWGMTS